MILLFCSSSMYAMNQITPAEIETIISDAELVAQALPSDTPPLHPKLISAVATDLRANANPESSIVTSAIVKAANDTLDNSINKRTAAYISVGCTIVGGLISALSAAYGNSGKC